MSDIERRIESLGRRIGTVVAATKLRVTEWGPTIQIHIRESVGGRILGPWRLVENARQTARRKVRHLHKLMEKRSRLREIRRYLETRYPNNPAVIQKADAIYKKGGIPALLAVLESMAGEKSLVYGSPEFDAELFDLISEPGDEIKVDGKVVARKVFVPHKEGRKMGVTIHESVRRLAELKAQKRLIEFLNIAQMAQGNRSRGVGKEPVQTGNDLYKNGGKELIVDMFKIFYDEILNAPSSNYTQKKRDPSQFPRAKSDPFDVF